MEKTPHNSQDFRSDIFPNILIIVLIILLIFTGYKLFSDISNIISAQEDRKEQVLAKDLIQVEVLNGCGKSGVADQFTQLLRKNNFDVVSTGNYKSFNVNSSIIIDRTGNIRNAKSLAEVLNIDPQNVIQQKNKNYFLDLTLIIGKDYNLYTK